MAKKKLAIMDDSLETTEKVEEIAQPEVVEKSASEEKKPTVKKAKQTKKSRKAVRAQTRGKKYQEVREFIERTKNYKLNEAIELAQKGSYSKFTGTIEAHLNTNSKGLRGLITLPYVAGKKLRIVAFGNGAQESGADIVGDEETLKEISSGKINFDVIVATPQWMPKLAPLARILGPRGLMPNPKSGTVTDNVKKAVEELQAGKVEYKTEPNGTVIHLSIGKVNQNIEEISANIKVLYSTIGKSRVKKMTLAATMGPGVRVDLSSI